MVLLILTDVWCYDNAAYDVIIIIVGAIYYVLYYMKKCLVTLAFLGRLPKVDLIILEGERCPSVRPQKVSSI